jgi:hypothetical protein
MRCHNSEVYKVLQAGLITCQDYKLAEGQNDVNIDRRTPNNRAIDGSVLRLIHLKLHGAPDTLKGKYSDPGLTQHHKLRYFDKWWDGKTRI